MKKKIGILAQYLETRHDIREYINALSVQFEVVVYLRENDLHLKKLLQDQLEVRPIRTQVRRSVGNHFMVWTYKVFGILPSSEHNYFITEFFKLNNAKLKFVKKIKESFLLHLSKYTPKLISYDGYLNRLRYAVGTEIDDIDEFLCFTQIYDDLFFAQLLNSKKKVNVYVYSWDHPCKMKTFSRRVSRYLVWNEGLKNDLIELQKIRPEQIEILGSTQLTYIHDFKKNTNESVYYDFNYLYFACATGYPNLVKQEVETIEKTARYLADHHPQIRLVVRTYPFFGAESFYSPLFQCSNVVIDDYKTRFDSQRQAVELIGDKLIKISGALGIIHFGTTFGLEAAYFNHPVVLADFVSQHPQLNQFVHQYQNDKYLHLPYPNVCETWSDFTSVLDRICAGDQKMMDYNKEVAAQTMLLSIEELVNRLV